MKIGLFKGKSIFKSWLISYFLLLLMPITISLAVYLEAVKSIEKESIRVNAELLRQVEMAIYNGMQDVKKFGTYVTLNANLNILMNSSDFDVIMNRYYIVYHAIMELKNINTTNGYVDDYYVYFKKTDSVLTTNGIDRAETFYNSLNKKGIIYKDIMSYEEWKKLLNTESTGEYIPLKGVKSANSPGVTPLIYLKSLPIYSSGQSNATFVISLNKQRFYDAVKSIGSLKDAWGIILDGNDNVIFSTKPIDKQLPVKYSALSGESGLLHGRANNESISITYTTSKVENWKYISIMPLRVFDEKVGYIRKLILWSILLSIFIGGTVAYIFSKKNYSPVSELVQNLGKKASLPPAKGYNEYNIIRDIMNNTFSANEKINEILKQQNKVLKSNFLMRLLKGRLEDEAFITNSIHSFDLHFDTEFFAVMLFYIVDFSKFYKGEDNSEAKYQLVQFIITNVVEELASRKTQGYVTEVDNMLACIINLKTGDYEASRQDMLQIATEARDILQNKFNIDFMVAISGVHKTIFGIPEAYHEAMSVIEYKMTMGKEDISCYDEIITSESSYYYPMEKEYQLINCIKTGEFSTAASIINEVFENNFKRRVLSNDMVRCLMFDLVSTMLKTVPEVNALCDTTFIQDLNIVERLLSYKKTEDMKNQMLNILDEICTNIQHNRKGKKDQLIEKVIEYIEKNYSDANMSVYNIAEKYQLTASYLTRLFRNKTGEGVSDYLTKVRMDRAKQLLKKEEISIKELAAMVGYYSSAGFIKAFKKYEGVTPGLFKETI